MTRLVTLRTKPIDDPGEWCSSEVGECCYWSSEWTSCELDYSPTVVRGGSDGFCWSDFRRPQECIDGQEEVKG